MYILWLPVLCSDGFPGGVNKWVSVSYVFSWSPVCFVQL